MGNKFKEEEGKEIEEKQAVKRCFYRCLRRGLFRISVLYLTIFGAKRLTDKGWVCTGYDWVLYKGLIAFKGTG